MKVRQVWFELQTLGMQEGHIATLKAPTRRRDGGHTTAMLQQQHADVQQAGHMLMRSR